MKKRDIEYFVNRERGIVVCKINNCEWIADDRINKYLPKSTRCLSDDYRIAETFTGIAKCAPEDTFDEEYGKKLALTRAKAARGKAVNDAIIDFLSDMDVATNNLARYGLHDIPKMD